MSFCEVSTIAGGEASGATAPDRGSRTPMFRFTPAVPFTGEPVESSSEFEILNGAADGALQPYAADACRTNLRITDHSAV